MVWVTDLLAKDSNNPVMRNIDRLLGTPTLKTLNKTPALIKCTVLARMHKDVKQRGRRDSPRTSAILDGNGPKLPPITGVNMLAAAAPEPTGNGPVSVPAQTFQQFMEWLVTATRLMDLAKRNEITTVATGYWGAGVFRICALVGVLVQLYACSRTLSPNAIKLIFYYGTDAGPTQNIRNFLDQRWAQMVQYDPERFVKELVKIQRDALAAAAAAGNAQDETLRLKWYVPQLSAVVDPDTEIQQVIETQQAMFAHFAGERGIQLTDAAAPVTFAVAPVTPAFAPVTPAVAPATFAFAPVTPAAAFGAAGNAAAAAATPAAAAATPAAAAATAAAAAAAAANRVSAAAVTAYPAANAGTTQANTSKRSPAGVLGAADGALMGVGSFIVVLVSYVGALL